MASRRAAVVIAVQQADKLPKLTAAWEGAGKMAHWAQAQGFAPADIKVITDESDPVDIGRVKKAVRSVVDQHVFDQLIIYFSGHGINSNHNEYWLLSDAMGDPDEAVNVTASEDLARYSGIPHVVFFSDACRTAAKGIGDQTITGGVIFRKPTNFDRTQKVDLFFATKLGHPALEVPTVKDAAKTYRAVYTDTLLEALAGKHPEIAEPDLNVGRLVVRPWPLNDFLEREVPARVFKATQRNQVPDAEIKSRPEAWIALLAGPPHATRGGGATPTAVPHTRPPLAQLTSRALHNATEDQPLDLPDLLDAAIDQSDEQQRAFESLSTASATTFGPTHFETGCGFKVTGARIDAVFAQADAIEIFEPERNLARLALPGQRPTNVLLVLDSGRCVVLPGLHEFMTALSFVEGELVNVSYDPMDYSWRWGEFEARRDELQRLRSVAAASSAMGSFRLAGDEEAERLARKMRFAKGFDPSLALYAAYAYRELGDRRRIEEMSRYQSSDLGITLFDIAMLSRQIDGTTLGKIDNILPFGPLLSQGWALLPAHDLSLPASLAEVRRGVLADSLWSLYDQHCVDVLKDAIEQGEI